MLHAIPFIAVLAYCVATYAFFRNLAESAVSSRLAQQALLVGYAAHIGFLAVEALGLYGSASQVTRSSQLLSFPFALCLVSALVIGFYLLVEQRWKISNCGVFVAPVGAIFMLFSGLVFHATQDVTELQGLSPSLGVFVGALIASLLFLSFSVILSVAIIVKESLLKKKRFTKLQQNLPPLSTLDRILGMFLQIGCSSIVAGILAAIGLGLSYGSVRVASDPRLVWALLLASIYAVLLVARNRGMRGSRAAWLSIAGFVMLIVSVAGVAFMGGASHVY